jgi:hypothetical protein
MDAEARTKSLSPRHLALNLAIAALGLLVLFLLYSFIDSTFLHKPVKWTTEQTGTTATGEVIQLDVLNGCGASGVAQRFTDYLRKRHFDVVQSSNYHTFAVEHSIVIDRVGDLASAKKVAYALGIAEDRVVQQINKDYYIFISVVIGRDYQQLKPYQ